MAEHTHRAWVLLRRRRRFAVATFLAVLPVYATVNAFAGRGAGVVAFFVFGFGAAGATLVYLHSRCPKCGKSYGVGPTYSNPFTTACMNCGTRGPGA